MGVDLERWQALVEQVEEARSIRRGLVAELSSIRDRETVVRGNLARLEDRFGARYGQGALPGPEAKIADYPVEPYRADVQTRPGMADQIRPILTLRTELATLNATAARYETRLAPIRQRLAELDALREACIAWARQNDVILPDASRPVLSAGLPEAASAGEPLNLGPAMTGADNAAAISASAQTTAPLGPSQRLFDALGRIRP